MHTYFLLHLNKIKTKITAFHSCYYLTTTMEDQIMLQLKENSQSPYQNLVTRAMVVDNIIVKKKREKVKESDP